MSDDLRRQLQALEADYSTQPLVVQQADLAEINRIRGELGMPLVDARLHALGAVERAPPKPKKRREPVPDHSEARAIYEAYRAKLAELDVHRAYAERVARATGSPGQTPVRPLATMGTDGGALLCDHCGKPMILEGGKFQGVHADVAWQRNPQDDWKSWISGGMVVEIQVNGTLRIYHGYPGAAAGHCCNIASRADKKAQDKFDATPRREKFPLICAFVAAEFPDKTEKERNELINDILNTMYSYDPGFGVNRPATE